MLIRALLSIVLMLAVTPIAQAADHAISSETIWPTQNDIALVPGDGKKILENKWEQQLFAASPNSYTLNGFLIPASSGNLNINIPAGNAYISGRYVVVPGITAVTAAASQTNYVFMKLTRDGGNLVTGASYTVNTTNIAPLDSIGIATLTASASAITATTDTRIFRGDGAELTSGSSYQVPAGVHQIYLEVIGASGGGGGGGGTGGGNPGSAGTSGGTTSFTTAFGTIQATGGGGGNAGQTTQGGAQGGVPGLGSGGTHNRRGGGNPGGKGGGGGGVDAKSGGNGADGGYVAKGFAVTPGETFSYAIGSAGAAGGGGSGSSAGATGRTGYAGMILIRY